MIEKMKDNAEVLSNIYNCSVRIEGDSYVADIDGICCVIGYKDSAYIDLSENCKRFVNMMVNHI